MEIGIDIGGTFTDVVLADGDRLLAAKLPSVPGRPDHAFGQALQHAADSWRVDLTKLDRLVHGTTVGTNILIERTAHPVGLLTTTGFRDVLDLGRQNRRDLYNLNIPRTDRDWLCPRLLRAELDERIDKSGISFVNPLHEEMAAEIILRRWPGLPVSLSSAVDPQFREYERTLTTLIDAYLKPDVTAYVARLNSAAASLGIRCPIEIARSRGAVTQVGMVAGRPIELTLSGPAAAVAGAAAAVARSRFRDVITIDIGGTSADIALVRDGNVMLRSEGEIGDLSLRCAMVDVSAIGAGGGSIASVTAGGLTVGPRSAGSDPGPVAYSRGGVEPTITDASLVLGYIRAEGFPGSAMRFDVAAAHQAIADKIATPLGLDVEAAALGMHMVLNARMAEAIRLITVKRGIDPRACALMPLGGGGGLHATALARMVGINIIIAPPLPGVMAALGLLGCPVEQAAAQAVHRRLDEVELPEILTLVDRLRAVVTPRMALEVGKGVAANETIVLEFCFQGQSNNVTFASNADELRISTVADIGERFVARYRSLFGHAPSAPIVLLRVEVVLTRMRAAPVARIPAGVGHGKSDTRMIRLPGSNQASAARLASRSDLQAEAVDGPLIVEQTDCTLLFENGWRVSRDPNDLLVAYRETA